MDKKSTLSAIDLFNEGLKCFHKPDGIGAVQAFKAVIKIDLAYRHEDGDNPYFYLGKISEIEGRIDDAILFYSSALTLDPYDEESLIGRGSCYTVKKNHKGAVVDFKKVLDIPPEIRNAPFQHVLYAIAENYRQQKDYLNALHWGEKALLEDPNNNRHQKLVAEVKKQMRDVP
ncbi:MAG: tetratricopeptide repeat protein [Desulfobacula sp.]|nr:tetratricopeptide repeat protein [Desulfobacula sp.]